MGASCRHGVLTTEKAAKGATPREGHHAWHPAIVLSPSRGATLTSSCIALQILQSQTRAVSVLEVELGTVLDFGGIRTEDAATALRRARKGALLNGSHALGVAGLVDGAANLQRLLGNARHACRGTEVHAQIADLVEQYVSSSPLHGFLGVIECQIRSLCLSMGGRLGRVLPMQCKASTSSSEPRVWVSGCSGWCPASAAKWLVRS